MTTPLTPIEQIREQLANVENALLTAHPRLPNLLQDIWYKLQSDNETVTLMTDEDVATLVRGLKYQTGVELVKTVKTKSPTSKAALKAATEDDV